MKILTLPRTKDINEIERRYYAYKEYIVRNKHILHESLVELVESDWYFNWVDHRCPHDSWVKKINICHDLSKVSIEIELLGAYHDLKLFYRYEDVFCYSIINEGNSKEIEWDIDEFMLFEGGVTGHSIRFTNDVNWLIKFRGEFNLQII